MHKLDDNTIVLSPTEARRMRIIENFFLDKGEVYREDLMREFEVRTAIAAELLRKFRDLGYDTVYDTKIRRHVPGPLFMPIFNTNALKDCKDKALGRTQQSQAAIIDWEPPKIIVRERYERPNDA